MKTQKKLFLPNKGRKIAGVAMGLSNYFNIDVQVIRIIWVLLILPGGLPGLLPYTVMWLMLPDENSL